MSTVTLLTQQDIKKRYLNQPGFAEIGLVTGAMSSNYDIAQIEDESLTNENINSWIPFCTAALEEFLSRKIKFRYVIEQAGNSLYVAFSQV